MKVLEVYAVDTNAARVLTPYFTSVVQAGRNTPDAETIYSLIDLNRHLIRDPQATFYVRVGGHSMTSAGIEDGDLLVVDCGVPATNGNIVVVALNGETMVKRLISERGITRLSSENGTRSTIEVNSGDTLDVIGVVLHSIRTHYYHTRKNWQV